MIIWIVEGWVKMGEGRTLRRFDEIELLYAWGQHCLSVGEFDRVHNRHIICDIPLCFNN